MAYKDHPPFRRHPYRWRRHGGDLAVGRWTLEELRTVFRRPTIEDWNPRGMEVQEALHLVAKGDVLSLAIPEVKY